MNREKTDSTEQYWQQLHVQFFFSQQPKDKEQRHDSKDTTTNASVVAESNVSENSSRNLDEGR